MTGLIIGAGIGVAVVAVYTVILALMRSAAWADRMADEIHRNDAKAVVGDRL